jgi:hypothetical protein
MSNLVISQYDFLIAKERAKMMSGPNPAIKVISELIPTPCFTITEKAINGASAHKNQVTRFGFTCPLNIS